MIARGRVKNGVVVLDAGACLPDGVEVMVVTTVREASSGQGTHSILDILPVSVGAVLRPLTSDDDLLSEMLDREP